MRYIGPLTPASCSFSYRRRDTGGKKINYISIAKWTNQNSTSLGAFYSLVRCLQMGLHRCSRWKDFLPHQWIRHSQGPRPPPNMQVIKLDRLSLAIEWRKGDFASLISQAADGQAISFLSACIFSIYIDINASNIPLYLSMRRLTSGSSYYAPIRYHSI